MVLDEKISVTGGLKNLIVNARKQKSFTAVDMSTQLGKSAYWLSNIENGRTKSIRKSELIQIIMIGYACTESEAEEKIEGTLHTSTTIHLSTEGFSQEQITLYDEEASLEDISKYRIEYDKLMRDLKQGFDVFFEHMADKQKVLDIMQSISRNLHNDLGFTLSLYALPWGSLTQYTVEEKQTLFRRIKDFVRDNGTCDKYKSKNQATEIANIE